MQEKKALSEFYQEFFRDRRYILLLGLTACFSYGFIITHQTVGIDDTPYSYYFEEGLAAIVGRWVLFLLNKVVHIAEFAPFITDLAGVLILMAAVTVWGVLFCSIFGDRIPRYGYWFFACIFLSCPLLSEVYTYYLHNGVAVGYLACGISVCTFREGLEGRKWFRMVQAAVCLWLALGCYESFMIVWLVGVCLLLLSERLCGIRRGCVRALCTAAGIVVCAMILRSIMIALVTGIFGLGYLKEDAAQRSVLELAGWILKPEAMSELFMAFKRLYLMYGVFAYAYYPIRIFVLAWVVIGCFCLWRSVRQRDIWILFLMAGSFAACFLLTVVEGTATLYRAAQFLPLVCGYGVLAASCAVKGMTATGVKRYFRGSSFERAAYVLSAIIFSVVLWNQCADMNRWFYVDYLKYEDAVNTVNRIAYELEQHFDTGKPVIFTDTYHIPESIVADAYVGYGSEEFIKITKWVSPVDDHLLEKYYRNYGVEVAQTPTLSVLNWAKYAFDNDEELARFFAMHGHTITPCLDEGLYQEAEMFALQMPHFPAEGSIVDMGEYIIVHF